MGILSAASAGVFLYMLPKLNLSMPPIFAITCMAAECGLCLAVFGCTFFPSSFTLDLNWDTGVLGFFSSPQCLYIILVIGFFTGASQYASLAIAQKYFTPLVISSAYLMEPIIAQTLGCMFEIDKIPGWLTVLGGLVTLAGILAITIGGYELEKI